jgi:hypothetical protein
VKLILTPGDGNNFSVAGFRFDIDFVVPFHVGAAVEDDKPALVASERIHVAGELSQSIAFRFIVATQLEFDGIFPAFKLDRKSVV